MRLIYLILFILCFSGNFMFSQQISIDDNVGLQSLIQDNLVNGCVDIRNISTSVNGNSSGFPSYGFFERAGSNFPFANGIVISTGGAASGGNGEITPDLSEGSTTWDTDPDLETALGITNTVNATSIEFDFVSISNQFQFNYILASEEYVGIQPCQFSDGFAFLIRVAGSSDPYQNIALVPGTTTPVNTSTIHNVSANSGGLSCNPQNEQFFAGYSLGDTNYNGRTTVLTASGSIMPNVTYEIKLVIADQTDGTFDSAVFIEGDSFRILDLGEDIMTCAPSATLDANLENDLLSYAWYRNGTLISGEIESTYEAVQDGTYSVVVVPLSGISCLETDEIVVVLNTEEPMDPISDFQICDDSSGNGIETFDLSTKNPEVEANAPFDFFTYSYHSSSDGARFNTGPITTPIPNTTSPQAIFIRVQDSDSDCISISSFNLIVNPLPTIIDPAPLQVCDGDDNPDGIAVIDLTVKDDEIISGQTNLIVSYHYNAMDASGETGANPIPSPYINAAASNERVFVRVVDINTGCISNTVLDVEVTISPEANRDTQYIDACDRDLNGEANFDLTEVIAEILDGLTNVSTTFHTTPEDAEMGTNAIADETNYQYNNAVTEPGSATIYLRIEDNTTGCATVVPFEIHTNLLLTGTDTGDFALCDDNADSTDTLDFDLNTVQTFIANDLPDDDMTDADNIIVTFYEEEDDRDNGVNSLDKTTPFSALSPNVLYITIENGSCMESTEITLLVNPILLFDDVTIPYCDTDGSGVATIDFQSVEPGSVNDIVTGGNDDFTVTYFPTQMDANDNNSGNQLPQFYNNTDPIETLFARIENVDSGCSTVNPFKIEVLRAPTTTQPENEVICDNDQDGFSIINIEDKIDEALPSRIGFSIDVFTNFEDADANTIANVIPVSERDAYNTETQTFYIRIEDTVSGTDCFTIVSFDAIINTLPIIPTDIIFRVCEDSGSTSADFILEDTDEDILNGQTNKEVYYFENEIDAIDGNLGNQIPKDVAYNSESKTIYVRVENITDPDCFSTEAIEIEVAPDPIYDPIIDFLVCDDASNNGFSEFDLQAKADEIQATSPNPLVITFHLTREFAENGTDPLDANYTNVRRPQSIFIRIESSASFCFVVEELGLNIAAAPDVLVGLPSLTACAPILNGEAIFDLTFYNLDTETADFHITDRLKQIGLIAVNYFEFETDINPNDGLDNTNEITNPSNFNSNAKNIYIKVSNTSTGCYTVVPVELIVNLPPQINAIGTIPICDNDTDTYDLSQVDSMIVDDISLVNISYHRDQTDADLNQSPLNTTYPYTASSHEIFIRVSNLVTLCPIVTSFTLQINENPIATTPPDLVDCDDDFDGELVFDLTENNTSILGGLTASDYNITFYENADNAANKIDGYPNMYRAFNGETIFARLENNNTTCFSITQFDIRINTKPEIAINDIVPLCNNQPVMVIADTGVSGDMYLWSTGSTDPQITIQPTDPGMYSVTITRPNTIGADCVNMKEFNVIPSEEAVINFTPTIDFKDPNRITVEIDNSRIGDYIFILDGVENTPPTSNIFENVSFGPHLVTVQDLNGCMDVTKPVFVFDIPKFVTPNNDNAYDTWHIIGADQLPGTIVYIYTRHGKLIKTLSHNSEGWNGTYNGQNMPSDDYWFSADIVQRGDAFNIRGHFTLKR